MTRNNSTYGERGKGFSQLAGEDTAGRCVPRVIERNERAVVALRSMALAIDERVNCDLSRRYARGYPTVGSCVLRVHAACAETRVPEGMH